MSGWIIPEPLAIPPMRTRRPPSWASSATCLSTRSVVRIAVAAASRRWPTKRRQGDQPRQQRRHGDRNADHTGGADQHGLRFHPNWSARAWVARWLSIRPRSPVQALACPELISTARARPPVDSNRSWQRSTQAARTRGGERPGAGRSLRRQQQARSGLPDGFRPAAIPHAANPWGAVTPPDTNCQGFMAHQGRLEPSSFGSMQRRIG